METSKEKAGDCSVLPMAGDRASTSVQQLPQPLATEAAGDKVVRRLIQAPRARSGLLPPVMIYLPGLPYMEWNSTSRIAELMAIKLSNGPGAFAVEDVRSPSKLLSNGQRIFEVKDGPILDIFMYDYRRRLQLNNSGGTGVVAALRGFAVAFWYFFRAIAFVLNAGKRAKSAVAKWQLVIGFGLVLVLVLSVVLTGSAVLASVGIWKEPIVTGSAAQAIALGATAFTVWLFFNARLDIQRAATQIEQIIYYAHDERHAAAVTGGLDGALDDLLEAQPCLKVHLFAYSFGALVAVDFLYPRTSLLQSLDKRHAEAIPTLTCAGYPGDVARLFMPHYLEGRQSRVPNLHWANIFNAADVCGSNLIDGTDFAEEPNEKDQGAEVANVRPNDVVRYTDEKLTVWNIWGLKGFFSHMGYWDDADNENCLDKVIEEVLPATFRHTSV